MLRTKMRNFSKTKANDRSSFLSTAQRESSPSLFTPLINAPFRIRKILHAQSNFYSERER